MEAIGKAANERLFVKASAPYRVFPGTPSRDAAVRVKQIYAQLLQILGPDNLVWGSDWPWTRFEGQHDYLQTLDWQEEWPESPFSLPANHDSNSQNPP